MGITREEVQKEKGINIFLCYAREDKELCHSLEKHLSALQRQGIVRVWHDRQISAGTEWESEIIAHLDAARIILLLVSPDFMDSDYCYGNEMKRAMERHQRGVALVIPIILRPVYFQDAPFGTLQMLPTDAVPVMSKKWGSLDEAFYDVISGIITAIKKITVIPSKNAPEILPSMKDLSSKKAPPHLPHAKPVELPPPSSQKSSTELPSPIIDAALLPTQRKVLSQHQILEPNTSRHLNQYDQADLAIRRVPQSVSTGYPSPFRHRWVFLLTYGTIAGIIQALSVFFVYGVAILNQPPIWLGISLLLGPPFIAGLIARITLRTKIRGFIPGFISGILYVSAIYIYDLQYGSIDIREFILIIIGVEAIWGLISLLGTGFAVLVNLLQKFLSRLMKRF